VPEVFGARETSIFSELSLAPDKETVLV